MHNPDLYQISNSLQKRDSVACLENHVSKIKWKKNNNGIIDIGSGDGSVTNMLKKFIPTDFTLLGCDISESMVNFANRHHGDKQTSFTVLDIGGDLLEGMRGSFDHVFSFYTLHWVQNQERAFTNIFNLLAGDGECFLVYLASHPFYDGFRAIATNNKWNTCDYLQNFEKNIPPTQYLQNPVKVTRDIMNKVGFVDIEVEIKDLTFIYQDYDTMKQAVKSINPFSIPKDDQQCFYEDFMKGLEKVNNNDFSVNNIRINYKLLVVHGHKPSKTECKI